MRFQVRQGFTCNILTRVAFEGGGAETQLSQAQAGATIDLTPEQAEYHLHQLEPLDEAATAWMKSKEFVALETPPIGLTSEQLRVITAQITEQLTATLQAAAPGRSE